MTNFEMMQTLDSKELAWLLMNNGDTCEFCINKHHNEDCADDNMSCIEGHRQFLEREITEEDMVMYLIAHNNVVIDIYNAMSDRDDYKIEYREFGGKKYANAITIIDNEIPPFFK